jgi:two-component system sensor histidine kinase KdpD
VSDPPITIVRSEDLLDESPPQRLARTFGLSRRRQLAGLVLALLLLPLLTLLLHALEGQLDLDAQVLLYLLAVVIVAMVGGVLVGIGSAIASGFLINYFFVDPVHTLTVADPDQVVTLIVFVGVAALVSGAVELAVRRARAAERALAEAETMSAIAGPELAGEDSLPEVLRRARETFNMESVALLTRRRGTGEWTEAEHAGWAPPGAEAALRFDVPIGPHLRLVGRGPALFAEDQRVLHAFAAAARTAFEGRQLSGEAEEARTLATVDQQRTALLAAVGHDLRTPLAGIKAAVTTLRQTDVQWSAEERLELLATIEEATDRLDAVVRNLLDASRLQAGALSVNLDAVALDDVVAAAVLAVPDGAGRVSVTVPEDLGLVEADRGLLQRVLVNVIDNALRYGGSERPVEVVAHAGGESAKIEVIDYGAGVSKEERERLFEPFQRLDDHGTGGVGLGLSVARGFIEAMGGAMVADQTSGGGLTMRIRLRLVLAGSKSPVRQRT